MTLHFWLDALILVTLWIGAPLAMLAVLAVHYWYTRWQRQ